MKAGDGADFLDHLVSGDGFGLSDEHAHLASVSGWRRMIKLPPRMVTRLWTRNRHEETDEREECQVGVWVLSLHICSWPIATMPRGLHYGW